MWHSVILVSVALLALAHRVVGHGAMIQPMARQMILYQYNQSHNPHDMGRGGGSIHVSKQGTLQWPDGVHNVCGDAPNDTRLITPGRVVATYRAGSEIAMSFFIATNHLGRLALQLCNLHAESEAECSAPLQRADGKGTWWYLPNRGAFRFEGSGPGYDYEDGSYVMRPFGNWSHWCNHSLSCDCHQYDSCTMFDRFSVFTTRWRLPTSGPWATCEHCILRSYWLTAHNCVPSCTREHPAYPDCGKGLGQPFCGSRPEMYPEEYWDCADVSIVADDVSVAAAAAAGKPVADGGNVAASKAASAIG